MIFRRKNDFDAIWEDEYMRRRKGKKPVFFLTLWQKIILYRNIWIPIGIFLAFENFLICIDLWQLAIIWPISLYLTSFRHR